MPSLFDEMFGEPTSDPGEAARRNMRALPRRFYSAATVRETPNGFAVELDGRPVRTPARKTLALPNLALAERVATEWQDQAEFIDPARMPLTRLANSIIDGVEAAQAEVAADIAKYLGSDLLFYRAEGPEGLLARQHGRWDPILAWAREAHGAQFMLSQGIVHVSQPEAALAALNRLVPRNPWRLGAVHVLTTLTGSALIALAIAEQAILPDDAWMAAHVDEDWNEDLWGRDELAQIRRAQRRAEFDAAVCVLCLVPDIPSSTPAPGSSQ